MKRAAVCIALLFLVAALPYLTFTEDRATVQLARAVYAIARDEKTTRRKLAGQSRDEPLEAVATRIPLALCGKSTSSRRHALRRGQLRAAHEALSGKRALPGDVM